VWGRARHLPRHILERMAPVTWMVMSRDISHSVRVADQPVVIAVLILDVDTGLIRGLSVETLFSNSINPASTGRALIAAMSVVYTQPTKPADSRDTPVLPAISTELSHTRRTGAWSQSGAPSTCPGGNLAGMV
jgi:hypothetical protein